jgi:glycosyltransferase involved in cell wall biosynthesis
MMRTGQNPAKFMEKVGRPERITVALVTYLPFLAGYFAEGLDVLRLCIDSLRTNTEGPYDLLVFDNGSAAEVVAYLEDLHAKSQIDYLILSRKNLGKGGAWDVVFPAAPGEILAYADGDVYFRPGWLPQAVHILETFPRVGMVSSRPMRTDPGLSTATLGWAEGETGASLERGTFIPWETFREHDVNLGQPEAEVRQRYAESQDLRVRYQGVEALIGAVHWQFVGYKSVLAPQTPLSLDRPMGQVRAMDARLNEAGYLRLMTTDPLVRHMGNSVPPEVRSEASRNQSAGVPARRRARRLVEWGPLRRLLLAIHNQIFRWYYRD